MEEMATRPMASVRLLLTTGIVGGEQAQRIADMHARRALVATPIASQPVGEEEQKEGRHAMVASYLVELPSHPNYRNICIGAALAIIPPADVSAASKETKQTAL